jgi:pimeloyl-ACP methyl ester carboxylesterase
MEPITHRIPGLVLTDHRFELPLDHADPGGPAISVFAREVTSPSAKPDLPFLVFFQGGPGFPSPRPTEKGGWIGRAVDDYRVLLLDQRGTGLSTPVLPETLAAFPTAREQADYLTHFRADGIVRDAELIRRKLAGDEPWSVLGQSFGGFCVTHYLSAAPEGLREAFITGGLAPIGAHPDEFYRATLARAVDRTKAYHRRYPGDAEILHRLHACVEGGEVTLPDGAPLTRRRLGQLGWGLGMSDGPAQLHYLLEEAFAHGGDTPSEPFLRRLSSEQPFETNPIYALLHEACVCDGTASRWSAERVRPEYPELDEGTAFTGEGIYRWMFEDYTALRPFAEAADLLAHTEWPRLYDPSVLATNTVPCAAALYYDDLYVERSFSEATADAIQGMRVWVTNEYEHNGLRADGATILDRLIAMARGEK